MGRERVKAVEVGRKPLRRRRKRGSTTDVEPAHEGGSPLLGLQSSAGNAAVSRLVEAAVQRETAVAAPEATDRPLLKGGEVSDEVAQLRMELNVAGADPQVSPSKLYDEQAIDAVKKFQGKHGLAVDGHAGPKTWGMLDAIARDRVPSKDVMDDLREKATAANGLYDAGDYDAARTLYRAIYRTSTLPPEVRSQFTWNYAACEHHLGNFDLAASLYQEYLDAPLIGPRDQRDADQRIRECRLHLPPSASESSVTDERGEKADKDRPEATDRPLLKGGEVSDEVAQLRMELNVAGADPQVSPSKLYDEQAIDAVKKFQGKHGLAVDGHAGPKTWGMLDAIARDRVPSKDVMDDLREKATAANGLYDAGDYDAARTLYRAIYRTSTLPPEVRSQFTWNYAACEHHLGNFDLAASLYQEYLDAPLIGPRDQRDADQRIRECRLHLPPSASESSVTDERGEKADKDRPEATDRPLLKGGEVSDEVAQLRMELNVAGADPQVSPSKLYDEQAIDAVKKFQGKHGLAVDGHAGPKTWGMLDAIARDRVPSKDVMDDLREKATAADGLYDAGDYDAARTLYRAIYRTSTLPPEVRSQFTWNYAACEHHLGNFDLAASLYQEYLDAPLIGPRDQRDADQRIRECRLHLPPSASESSVTDDREKALGL